MVGVALAIGCSGGEEVAPTPTPGDEDARREFLEIAERLRAGDNQYFGLRPLEKLRAELAEETLEDPQRLFLLMRLAEFETKQGLLREGTAHADEAVALVAETASRSKPDSELRKALAAAHLVRALAYLRLAEQQNCVAHPMDRSCIFPIEGNGVYANPVAAEEALAGLKVFLERNRDDLEARWLVNIMAMALGRHPDGVDAAYRIDPRSREAADGLPRFIDISSAARFSFQAVKNQACGSSSAPAYCLLASFLSSLSMRHLVHQTFKITGRADQRGKR